MTKLPYSPGTHPLKRVLVHGRFQARSRSHYKAVTCSIRAPLDLAADLEYLQGWARVGAMSYSAAKNIARWLVESEADAYALLRRFESSTTYHPRLAVVEAWGACLDARRASYGFEAACARLAAEVKEQPSILLKETALTDQQRAATLSGRVELQRTEAICP